MGTADNDQLVPIRLSPQDDRFCALFSFGMSVEKAYAEAYDTVALTKGEAFHEVQRILMRPEIDARIAQLNNQFSRVAGITKAGHLAALAEIRDRALDLNEVGIAFQSEKARGQVAGFYNETVVKATRSTIESNGERGTARELREDDLSALSDAEVESMAMMVEKMQRREVHESVTVTTRIARDDSDVIDVEDDD